MCEHDAELCNVALLKLDDGMETEYLGSGRGRCGIYTYSAYSYSVICLHRRP